MNSLDQLTASFFAFITTEFFKGESNNDVLRSINFDLNTDAQKQQFGDISSNAAMVLAKLLQKNPRAVAQQITEKFSHPLIARTEIAGPGFINLFLNPQAFQQLTSELYEQKNDFFKKSLEEPTLHYSLEFVSANPTGPLHIGHGRGGIIGDVLARILEIRGHNVTTEFYINDAGNQIKKLGESFKIRCLQQLAQNDTSTEPLTIPEDGYAGEYLIELAQTCIAQYGNTLATQPLEFFENYAKETLLNNIKTTLAQYGITFDVWFSEKTLHESGAIAHAITLLQRHGFIYEKDDALWFASTQFGDDKDRVVKKSSGELTYVAADIAYLINKIDRGFNKLIMVLGQDHHSYVVRLKAVLAALKHNPADLDVILYQLVTLKESGELVRLSKRAGRIVSLHDIITTVGTDVARFFYLNRKADAHLEFDIALALKKTDENPVYYIQYAYVRTASILEKAQTITDTTTISIVDAQGLSPSEYLLLKKIISLKQVLESINKTYSTHMLAYYIIELAHLFHSYYAVHRVINAEDIPTTRARLLLIILLRRTFATCMELLGVSRPERM